MEHRPNGPVDVYAGVCRVEDGTLRVEHAALRAVNPIAALLVAAFFCLVVYSALTGASIGRPGSPTDWRTNLGFAALLVATLVGNAYHKDVLTDQSIPLSAVTGVRVETESRGWYLKQTRTLPVVVVEYSDGRSTATYPIRLSLHGDAYRSELQDLTRLLESQGFRVRDERSEAGTDETLTADPGRS